MPHNPLFILTHRPIKVNWTKQMHRRLLADRLPGDIGTRCVTLCDFCRRNPAHFLLYFLQRKNVMTRIDWVLPQIDLSVCDRCGLCVLVCPTGALALAAGGPYFSVPVACTYCTECEAVCPQSAVACAFQIVGPQAKDGQRSGTQKQTKKRSQSAKNDSKTNRAH